MSINDLLSQDEIDALLHGVDSGAVDTQDAAPAPGEARAYDFASQDRIIRGRMPTLERSTSALPVCGASACST